MHIGQRIKSLVEKKTSLNKVDFADIIGHTEQSLHGIFKKEDINTKLLKTICKALNITISDFFAESNQTKQNVKGKQKRAHVTFELDYTDTLEIDLNNKKLHIIKK